MQQEQLMWARHNEAVQFLLSQLKGFVAPVIQVGYNNPYNIELHSLFYAAALDLNNHPKPRDAKNVERVMANIEIALPACHVYDPSSGQQIQVKHLQQQAALVYEHARVHYST